MPKKAKQPAGLKKYWASMKKKTKRKTTTRRRRTTRKGMLTLGRKRAYTKRNSNKPTKRRSSGLKLPKLPNVLKKVAIGLGAATLAGMAVGVIAPQFAGIAKPVAALAAGGIPGVAAELIVDQGILGNVMGIFNGGGINQQRLAAGL